MNKADTKNEDDSKNESDPKSEDHPKNEDNLRNKDIEGFHITKWCMWLCTNFPIEIVPVASVTLCLSY